MDDTIPISALQHYAFCPRQCAYIHIERLWQDNFLTAKGNQLHERVHSNETEKRGNLKTERGVQVSSEQYGLVGQLDLLEIHSEPFQLTPVEYKRGKPKISDCDRIQLCAQVLCLEEMRNVSINRAALWYWQVRKREWIEIDESIRNITIDTIDAVHKLIESNSLPKAIYTASCKACSFFDSCQPRKSDQSARYVKELFRDEEITE
jgi:CRISPR-associated exonuclease Cas4